MILFALGSIIGYIVGTVVGLVVNAYRQADDDSEEW